LRRPQAARRGRRQRHPRAHRELLLAHLRHRRRRARAHRHRRQPAGGHDLRRGRGPAQRAAAAGPADRQRIAPGAAGRRPHLGGQRDRRDGPARPGDGLRAEPLPAHELAPAPVRRPVQSQPRRHLRGGGAADRANPRRAGRAEAVGPPTSRSTGKTAADLQLRRQYGISLLAINRDKTVIRDNVRNTPLRAGDMLVLHSIWQDLAQAAGKRDFVIVTDFPKGEQRPHKFRIAMVIFAVTMLIAVSGRVPTSIALMTGVAGMLVFGVLKMDEAYSAISWKTVFLMACLIPLGWAMDASGAAAWLAGHTIERLPEGMPIWLIQFAVSLLTAAFSMVISHVGATIVVVPLAINFALAANGNPTAFALIVALSA